MLKLSDMLAPERISFETEPAGQKQLFERLGGLLAAATPVRPAQIAMALAGREKLGTTGFGGGVAIPHGRVAGIDASVALLRLRQPVDWLAVDGLPVDVVVALVTSPEAGAGHLRALALVGRTLRDAQFVAKLRGADSADAIWAILHAAERRAA